MSTDTAALDSITEGAARDNAAKVLTFIGKKAKRVEAIVENIQNKFKDPEKHLTQSQVKNACKALQAAGLVETENVKTGVKGRPPVAYKLPSGDAAEAAPEASA